MPHLSHRTAIMALWEWQIEQATMTHHIACPSPSDYHRSFRLCSTIYKWCVFACIRIPSVWNVMAPLSWQASGGARHSKWAKWAGMRQLNLMKEDVLLQSALSLRSARRFYPSGDSASLSMIDNLLFYFILACGDIVPILIHPPYGSLMALAH